ncbi:tRNA (N6-threonylcarbamoyladenosine(37)-N6)-methyltransferase TrmO [Gilvimarinus polysaccharolyticus]|uniref:tRNA (N6-threonylcarbamoyladenosine(37)-N6)-methyltransferase TrmO n=1 Tax=Gilvimarinus polysaccharolyticus TaxID=863921 RepID=UPI0006733274|nr:tRNA (N6-threonylcarbamoyladenosine(37)-N6)-methyltransferase TrmO [Gilvimarinus polysaccharolyticus]
MFEFEPIGVVRSCFTDKFGIPRQSGLAPAASATVEFHSPYNDAQAFVGLEGCSHLWLQFVFHANRATGFRPRVRPPRLGGNKTLGVFATRSPVRPNPIGLSVVKLDAVIITGATATLAISGHDLLDGTPILDVKPYVPYTDSLPNAVNPVAPEAPVTLAVSFSANAVSQCQQHSLRLNTELATLLRQLLAQDPRPQYQTPDPARSYAMALFDLDVQWHYRPLSTGFAIEVSDIRLR